MKKIYGLAAATALAAFSAPAYAATCGGNDCHVTDSSGGTLDPLDFDNSIGIQDHNVPVDIGETRSYNASGSFDVASDVGQAVAIADVSFSNIIPPNTSVAAGFSNLAVSFMQSGADLGTFNLTGADGTVLNTSFALNLVSNAAISFDIVGSVFRNFGAALPDYNIDISATSPVPLPAALPLLLSGIAGLGFSMRRKKNGAVA